MAQRVSWRPTVRLKCHHDSTSTIPAHQQSTAAANSGQGHSAPQSGRSKPPATPCLRACPTNSPRHSVPPRHGLPPWRPRIRDEVRCLRQRVDTDGAAVDTHGVHIHFRQDVSSRDVHTNQDRKLERCHAPNQRKHSTRCGCSKTDSAAQDGGNRVCTGNCNRNCDYNCDCDWKITYSCRGGSSTRGPRLSTPTCRC